MFGPPGTGKSYTGYGYGCILGMGCGEDMAGYLRPVNWPRLYVNIERSERSMAARLARVNVALRP